MLSNFKSLSDIFTYIEDKLGFRKFAQYVIFIILVYTVFNFKSIVTDAVEIYREIVKEQHEKKLELRSELLAELNPMLTEIRAEIGADRVLYFEYHNSTENLVGIPFMYADLVLSVKKYGVTDYNVERYKDINSGLISSLYQSLKKNQVLINKGNIIDEQFDIDYPGISNFIKERDGSVQQCFLNLPGIISPIGMIIVEWTEIDENRNWETIKKISLEHIPRINALVLSKIK